MRIALAIGAVTALCLLAAVNVESWFTVAVQPEIAVLEYVARVMR